MSESHNLQTVDRHTGRNYWYLRARISTIYKEKGNSIFTNFFSWGAKHVRNFREVINNIFFNHVKTKRRLLYLKTQFVPRSKHFSSRL